MRQRMPTRCFPPNLLIRLNGSTEPFNTYQQVYMLWSHERWLAPGSPPCSWTIESESSRASAPCLAVLPCPLKSLDDPVYQASYPSLRISGVQCQLSPCSPAQPHVVLAQWSILRREIRGLQPDIVHAHYGNEDGILGSTLITLPLCRIFVSRQRSISQKARTTVLTHPNRSRIT